MAHNLSDCPADRPVVRVAEALERGHEQLRDAGRPGARLEAELLLAQALQRPRSYLITHAEEPLPAPARALYRGLLARAAAGEPLAYLVGEREFWSLPLIVSPQVLIPRPETELAVERCLALLAPLGQARLCDLGTGAGSIALALAAERPAWRITATDVSAAALDVARANAARHRLTRIEFVLGDWLEPLTGRTFDCIVSNPPYVARREAASLQLRYEPQLALTPGATGLEALLRLIAQARGFLAAGGWLVLEHGADQRAAVAAALVAAGFARVRCHRDLAGHDRISEGQRP